MAVPTMMWVFILSHVVWLGFFAIALYKLDVGEEFGTTDSSASDEVI
jgi:hypothetical protein